MAKQVFDSPDLLRLIYSFGDPTHRKFTRNLALDIQANPRQFSKKYQETKCTHTNSYSMDKYLYMYSTSKIEQYLHTYKRCFCCTRHNKEKPILFGKNIVITHPSVFENVEGECDCPCRSLSRIFIRHLTHREFNMDYILY